MTGDATTVVGWVGTVEVSAVGGSRLVGGFGDCITFPAGGQSEAEENYGDWYEATKVHVASLVMGGSTIDYPAVASGD